MDILQKEIIEDVDYVSSLIILELQKKLQEQGYGTKTKSRLQQSMENEVKQVATLLVSLFYMEDYFIYVEKATPASRIPFNPSKKSGKKFSKYIQGLFRYWRVKRGLQRDEALRAAFALARKHKKEGRPLRPSIFSKDGTRTGFIEQTLTAIEQRVFEILERRVGDRVEIAFTTLLFDFAKESGADIS